jgi:hypothetical protein
MRSGSLNSQLREPVPRHHCVHSQVFCIGQELNITTIKSASQTYFSLAVAVAVHGAT